jgi:hypothetical protein
MEEEKLKKALDEIIPAVQKIIDEAPKKKEDKLAASRKRAEEFFKQVDNGAKLIKI